jgi:maltose alpha-D-glucosyltransferase/alpha-amylase
VATAKKRVRPVVPLTDDPLWYKDAVIYELHVRAFTDSNGDGIGDFRGLTRRLDYLQDLGVTALWLLPFYPSPLRDDGYDIADYTSVNPIYGTLSDFRLFLRAAHRRGLRVITELVVNHTSDRHPWFQRARTAPPGSPERDFYVWSDTPDRYREARIIFKDFEPSNWAWDPVARTYYWHRFFAHQPDLNYDNPEVHKAIFRALDFWLDMGIDGLRLDAVPYLYEREGTNCENLPETHQFLRALRRHVEERYPNRMLLAEANQWPEDSAAYFGDGDECHMAFHFPVMPRLFMSIRMEDRFPIIDILRQTPAIPATSQWALFLRNHDELTLEMVTDEDRDYMYRMYAQDPQARINLGIRRRLAPLLENHRGKIELMNGLLLSLPGTPVLYYGDEIGMGDNIYLGDRNGVRTPMQWSPARNAGFSKGNPQRLYLPTIIDPAYHFEHVNVEAQQNNPHSLLWWMKRLIGLRKRHQAFSRGTFEFLAPRNHRALAFIRRYQGESVLVVANLSRFAQYVELDLSKFKGATPVEMLGRTPFPPVSDLPYVLTLGPYAFYWFLLESPGSATLASPRVRIEPAPIEVQESWEEVLSGPGRAALEELLPGYLRNCQWFCGARRQTEAAMVLETIPIPYDSTVAHVALVQVEYTEGDSETYLLPLAFAAGAACAQIERQMPHAIVARMRVRAGPADAPQGAAGVIFDPTGEPTFSLALLEAIGRKRRFRRADGEIVGTAYSTFRRLKPAGARRALSLWPPEQSNTSIQFDDAYILKMFRRVEEGVNPELEVGRFLGEKTSFRHVAPVAGALEYRRSWGQTMTLGVLEVFVANEGDAWRYTQDMLMGFFDRVLPGQARLEDVPAPPRQFYEVEEVPQRVQELIGPYVEAVRLLGRRTAELHLALASGRDDPSFAPEPFTAFDHRSLYQSLRAQALQAFEGLRKRLGGLPDEVRRDAERVLALEERLLAFLRRIFEHKITALKIRYHGNYHLGQLLYTGKDYVVVDFDGDVSRPLSDRRRKRLALADVANMLRSFHYAAFLALRKGDIRTEDVPALVPWARYWYSWISTVFLKAYREAVSGHDLLPTSNDDWRILLDYSLLKRMVGELQYELDAHPDRATIPLRGILHVLDPSA